MRCDLVTGQVVKRDPEARHVSCTVEVSLFSVRVCVYVCICMFVRAFAVILHNISRKKFFFISHFCLMCPQMADLSVPYECAVIDEYQLLGDPSRGWAWTRAYVLAMCFFARGRSGVYVNVNVNVYVCMIIISPYRLRHWLRLNDDKRLYYPMQGQRRPAKSTAQCVHEHTPPQITRKATSLGGVSLRGPHATFITFIHTHTAGPNVNVCGMRVCSDWRVRSFFFGQYGERDSSRFIPPSIRGTAAKPFLILS